MSKVVEIIPGLSDKQSLFVSEYLKNGGNATQAYIKAGYTAKNEKTAGACAARMLANAKVSRAIAERQKERNHRLQLEEDFELKQAMKILQMCSEPTHVYVFDTPLKDSEGNYVMRFDARGANEALTTICKLRGKFVEKKQIDVTLSDRSDWLAEALKDVNTEDDE